MDAKYFPSFPSIVAAAAVIARESHDALGWHLTTHLSYGASWALHTLVVLEYSLVVVLTKRCTP